MGEIRALTGLRGIGAACVLAYHLCLLFGLSGLHGMLLRGYLAVDMFFVLSGFVLARSHGAALARDRSLRAYAAFAATRFVRLWPLYAVVTLAVLVVRAAAEAPTSWPNQVVANLLMMQSWGLSGSIVAPGWSVSTEWAASLLFPLLALAALQSRPAAGCIALGCAVLALFAAPYLAQSIPHGRRGGLDIYDGWSLLPLVRCLAGVCIGILLFRATRHPGMAGVLGRGWPAAAAASAIVAGSLIGVADGWLYPAVVMLVGGLACGGGWIARVLGTPVIVWAGRLSYGIYLLHVPVLDAATALGLAGWWPLVPPVVLALAALAHAAVEQPAQAWWRAAPARPALS